MIADFPTLAKLAGTKKPGGVKAWLARNRIKYFVDTKGHPSTTLSALDRALNRGSEETEPNYDPPPWQNSRAASPSPASTKKTAGITKSSRTSGIRSQGSTKASTPSSEPSKSSIRSDPEPSES